MPTRSSKRLNSKGSGLTLVWCPRIGNYAYTQPEEPELWRIAAYTSIMPKNRDLYLHVAQDIKWGVGNYTSAMPREPEFYLLRDRDLHLSNALKIWLLKDWRCPGIGTYAYTQPKNLKSVVRSYTSAMPVKVGTYAYTRPNSTWCCLIMIFLDTEKLPKCGIES